MKKSVFICMALSVLMLFTACTADPSVLLTFSEGTLNEIEYDSVLQAQFKPDNLMKNHGFELFIKYYFVDDKLTACDHIYKFETRKEAQEWYECYSEALNSTEGCYISNASVIKNETEPSLKGKSLEEVKTFIEYNFYYIDSEIF